MVLKTVTAANEVPDYTQLQQQIHDALRAQHPEWVQPNGDSPTCDAYEWRLAELLQILGRDSADKKCAEIRKFRGALLSLTTENVLNRHANRAGDNSTKNEHNG